LGDWPIGHTRAGFNKAPTPATLAVFSNVRREIVRRMIATSRKKRKCWGRKQRYIKRAGKWFAPFVMGVSTRHFFGWYSFAGGILVDIIPAHAGIQ